MVKAAAQCDERNYPEVMGTTIVLNAPTVFPALYRICKACAARVAACAMRR
jgi:hypothetical protein